MAPPPELGYGIGMMARAPVAIVASLVLSAATATADPSALRLAGRPDLEWSLPYTFGTHRGTADSLTVDARADASRSALASLVLRVPVESLHSGNATRDCHLREALGIDYKGSRYPAKHVCDGSDTIPPTGRDRVAFPEIVFEMSPESAPLAYVPPAPGRRSEIEIPGRWTIHGVSWADRVKATVTTDPADPAALRVEGEHDLSLGDFGVVVKPFLLVKVGDRVHVKFAFTLAP